MDIDAKMSAVSRIGALARKSFSRAVLTEIGSFGGLFDLAKAYSAFFENCPVLRAETDEFRTSRLLLCDLTARTIRLGLDLLNIQVVERM